jgi:hypothetical protein
MRKKTLPAPSAAALAFADAFRATLPGNVSLPTAWREQWACAYDDMLRIDKRQPQEAERVWRWARADEFWAPRFLSPLKLRKRNREGVTYFRRLCRANERRPPAPQKKNPPI